MRSLAAILTRSARESACIFYVAPVGFHCYLADTEFPTNTFIQQVRDHRTFTTGKGCVPVSELLHVRLASQGRAAAVKSLEFPEPDAFETLLQRRDSVRNALPTGRTLENEFSEVSEDLPGPLHSIDYQIRGCRTISEQQGSVLSNPSGRDRSIAF
jgi:hypothetical protein